MNTATLVVILVSGLAMGAIYALIAEGLNLIWGVMKIVNLAHGELLMIGAFTALYAAQLAGWNPLVAMIPAFLLLFAVGLGLNATLMRRIVGAPELTSLLLTFGLSILITNLGVIALGAEFQSVDFLQVGVSIAGGAVAANQLVVAVAAVALSFVMYGVLRRTRLGRAIRAVAIDGEMAERVGINTRRIHAITFGLGAALAGVAGALVSSIVPFNPLVGQTFILKAFAVVVLGGMGNFMGALVGGLLLGVVEAAESYLWSVQLSEGVAFVMIILTLLLRPSGILGGRS
ncbi:MAG: branched-chain amino acid ABC transporter permease [Acidimicrobiia bacterium]|nr:branched-chain amino acid ABC transporter permease [Acidimicrobiia bacterium]